MTARSRVRELIDILAACGPSDRRALALVREELTSIADALEEPSDRAAAPPPLDAATVAGLIDEASEHLSTVERALNTPATGIEDSAMLDTCLRSLHSVKGAAGFLRLGPAVRVVHAAESLLGAVRSGTAALTPDHIRLLLRSTDVAMLCFATPRESGEQEIPHLDTLVGELQRAARDALDQADGAAPPHTEAGASHFADSTPPSAERSFRISAARADALATLVHELESSVHAFTHDTAVPTARHPDKATHLRRLEDTIAQLHAEIGGLRMCSLRHTVQHLRRLVHDLSTTLGRPVSLRAEGADIEFDRCIVDALSDPLRHLVRNACDHGIEAAPDRLAAAKPAEGRISLRVVRQDGSIVVEVSDDGRGLDRDRILRTAVARGLLSGPDAASSIPDDELCRLVLAPGFTTRARATEVSGCGFGLDIVHRRIASLGGRLEISPNPGRGMSVRIIVPLGKDARLRSGPRGAAA